MPENQSTKRLHLLLWMLLGWSGLIFCRLVFLQVIHHDDLLRQAQQQQQRTREIPALRGTIFDRTGQPLAKSMPTESVCVNPQKIPDPGMAADILSRVLDLNRARLFEKIQTASMRHSGFLWIKRKIAAEEAQRLRSLSLDWVEFRPEVRRFYPHHTLAAHALGSVGITDPDDTIEHGNAGIEASFEEDLAGQPGLSRVYTDVKQNPYDAVVARKPETGADLTLTIDANLQYEAEKQLDKVVHSSHAKTGSIIAMNPYTGEILAMANYPTYDPNNPPSPAEPENARSNLAITTPFEPGSVFKTITLSAALETTRLRPDTMINCGNGSINLFGRIIHDHKSYSALSMADVLAHSSNIGAIQIGLKVGDATMYKYVRKFGFGRKTGVDLPGESAGLVRRVEQWTPSSIGSVAMGHEISTTSIQLAIAGATIANGGMLVKPQMVLSRHKPGEADEKVSFDKPVRIIQPETAIQMRQMMEGVVLHGTGKGLANLRGYTSGGKTGSAQIYDLKAHVYTHSYNASFLGFAPVANPQIVIAVTLNGTTGGTAGYGGPVAAPVFRDIAMTALRMLDVPKDLPDGLLRTDSRKPSDVNDLSIAGLGKPPALEQPPVSSVTPPPVPADSAIHPAESDVNRRPFFVAEAGPKVPYSTGPKVPDFQGMSLRAVLEESSARGLSVETLGAPERGLVREQDPPAGSSLPAGKRVRVHFAR
ncbi:MAG TPA: penicillin-binding protein [Bryobacteraceae bacterium]|nr:penicillin-binding protein [Bryobacteraceae bacterium]